MDKKGDATTSTIIYIILGAVLLVILIYGTIQGWDKLFPWISPTNVDTVVAQCSAACSMRSVYEFCSREKELKAPDLPPDTTGAAVKKVTGSCEDFSNGWGMAFYKDASDPTRHPFTVDYGIEKCLDISCPKETKKCLEIGGKDCCATSDKCPQGKGLGTTSDCQSPTVCCSVTCST
jgi:hypothetical protein